MVCCFFRFRDQEFLKSLIFAKNETEIPELASLKQRGFSFQRKTQGFKDFYIPAKSKTADHFEAPLPSFPRLSILRAKRVILETDSTNEYREKRVIFSFKL